MSNLLKGLRWESQRAAELCAGTGGELFERSELSPPQALRQATNVLRLKTTVQHTNSTPLNKKIPTLTLPSISRLLPN